MPWFVCCGGKKGRDKHDDDDAEDDYTSKEEVNSEKDIPTYNNNVNDLTKDPICNTIQELKAKLGGRDICGDNSEEEVNNRDDDAMIPEAQRGVVPHPPPPPLLNQDGLIIPRKLHNPVLHNGERQSLHRELRFNQKMGKNVLNQKSELAKAMEKHKDSINRKEFEHKLASQTPELVKVIQDRAKRLEEVQTPTHNEDDKGLNNIFLQARAKLRTPTDMK